LKCETDLRFWKCETDFYIQRNADTKQLANILRSANLKQRVQERAHRHEHILSCHMIIII